MCKLTRETAATWKIYNKRHVHEHTFLWYNWTLAMTSSDILGQYDDHKAY